MYVGIFLALIYQKNCQKFILGLTCFFCCFYFWLRRLISASFDFLLGKLLVLKITVTKFNKVNESFLIKRFATIVFSQYILSNGEDLFCSISKFYIISSTSTLPFLVKKICITATNSLHAFFQKAFQNIYFQNLIV